MKSENLRALFPRASEAFVARNPAVLTLPARQSAIARAARGGKGHCRGSMNRTESEFALRLEAMKRAGEIQRWEYEGLTLRFAGVRYTPDFVVLPAAGGNPSPAGKTMTEKHTATGGNPPPCPISGRLKLIEVKGAFTKGKFERAIERFRHARTFWPEFDFELHQKTKAGWKRLL